MGQCFSSNVVVLYSWLSPLTQLTQATTYSLSYASNELSCAAAGAGSSDICIFHCDTASQTLTEFNCDSVSQCIVLCDQLKCMEQGTINANSASYLNVTSLVGGQECFKKATVNLPDSGDAIFTMDEQKAFKNMKVYSAANSAAGTRTGNVIIDCTYGVGDECKGLTVYGADATYLQITVGASSVFADDNKVDPSGLIQCPQYSDYSGPEVAACIIDLSGGGGFDTIPIETINGIPADVYIKTGSTEMTSITVSCTVPSIGESSNDGNTFSDTGACWNSPAPTTSVSPTKFPSLAPTESPSTALSSPPSQSPSTQPSAAPTKSPNNAPFSNPPTKQPSASPVTPEPTKTPLTAAPSLTQITVFPTLSPVELPGGEVDEATTLFTTYFGTQDADAIAGGKEGVGPMHVALGGVAGVLICFLGMILWCFCKYKTRAKVVSFDDTNAEDAGAIPEGNASNPGTNPVTKNRMHVVPVNHGQEMQRVYSVEAIEPQLQEEESSEDESTEEEDSSEPGSPKAGNAVQMNFQNGPLNGGHVPGPPAPAPAMNNYQQNGGYVPPPSSVVPPPSAVVPPAMNSGYVPPPSAVVPPPAMNNVYVPPPNVVPGPPAPAMNNAMNNYVPPPNAIPGPPAPANVAPAMNNAMGGSAFVYRGGIGGGGMQAAPVVNQVAAAPNVQGNQPMKVTPFELHNQNDANQNDEAELPPAPAAPVAAQQGGNEEYEYYEDGGQGGGDEDYEYYEE